MPNNQNAKKAMKQNEKSRLRNRVARTVLRNVLRKAREAATSNDAGALDTAIRAAMKKVDQAASKNIIHQNKASRLKSRMMLAVAKAKQSATPPATGG